MKQSLAKLPSMPRAISRVVAFLIFEMASAAAFRRFVPEAVLLSQEVKLHIFASMMAMPVARRPSSPSLSQ